MNQEKATFVVRGFTWWLVLIGAGCGLGSAIRDVIEAVF